MPKQQPQPPNSRQMPEPFPGSGRGIAPVPGTQNGPVPPVPGMPSQMPPMNPRMRGNPQGQPQGQAMPATGQPQLPMPEMEKAVVPTAVAEYIKSRNLAKRMTQEKISELVDVADREREIDEQSRIEWLQKREKVNRLVLQEPSRKTDPWPDCSNTVHPLITIAAHQFGARAYKQFVAGNDIASAKTSLEDPTGGYELLCKGIGRHMSTQLLDEMGNWEGDMDSLLNILPIGGLYWKKFWYDRVTRKVKSSIIPPEKVAVNYWAPISGYPGRLSYYVDYQLHEIQQFKRAGIWLEDFEPGSVSERGDQSDTMGPWTFVEQHRYYDLDEDGYAEPIIITYELETKSVVRISANFDEYTIVIEDDMILNAEPIRYFVPYHFLPSPDGSFYSTGFGELYALNLSVNSLMNQIVDAGTRNNEASGFLGRGANVSRGSSLRLLPGHFAPVDASGQSLRDNIMFAPDVSPSPVSFQLLEFLLKVCQQYTSISDEMTGQRASQTEAYASVVARLQEGMKLFSSIHQRMYRSMRAELQILYELNRRYAPAPYNRLYQYSSLQVKPSADPNVASDLQRISLAQASLTVVAQGGGNVREAARDMLEAMNVTEDKINRYFPQDQAPAPSPEQLKAQAEIQMMQQKAMIDIESKKAELQIKQQSAGLESQRGLQKLEAEIQALTRKADLEIALLVARQESEERMAQVKSDHEIYMKAIGQDMDRELEAARLGMSHEAAMAGHHGAREESIDKHALEMARAERQSLLDREEAMHLAAIREREADHKAEMAMKVARAKGHEESE